MLEREQNEAAAVSKDQAVQILELFNNLPRDYRLIIYGQALAFETMLSIDDKTAAKCAALTAQAG
jgi:hypothetical protein